MSFKDLELTNQLIAELYKYSLLESLPQEKTAVKVDVIPEDKRLVEKSSKEFSFLGNHEKHISIIVNFPGTAYIPETHLSFLVNVLKACNLNIGDIAIINQGRQLVDIDNVMEGLETRVFILFGVPPASINLKEPLSQFSISDYNGTSILNVPSLNELNNKTDEAKLLKGKLWVCLKQLFNV